MNVALRPQSLNLISLCTGGGGLDIGFELAIPDARPVVLVEREAFAIGHLVAAMQQGLLADAPVWSDVTTFDGRPWHGLVDGVIGGIPCQPHSLAGKRLGEDDERDLWSDARRIIVQSGAWFVLIENVRGMLSSGGAERVWRDLRRLGFTIEAGLFTASETGASHERERIFILAVADRESCFRRTQFEARGTWRGRTGFAGVGDQLADPCGAGLALGQQPEIQRGNVRDEGAAVGEDCHGMVYPARIRRGEGRSEPEFRSGRDSSSGSDDAMGNAIGCGYHGRPNDTLRRAFGRAFAEGASEQSDAMDDAARGDGSLYARPWRPGERASDLGWTCDLGIYPPGPSDLDGWRRVFAHSPFLEPAVRRMANGVAARLDLAGPHAARVDRHRMLGNGVVPLQAAYAVRTLAARLAARGSAGADQLLGMMQ